MRTLSLITLVLLTISLSAKKVKFAVDMTGQTVSANGVHIASDFQSIAGLGADWDPGTATMTQEGSGNIYSIVVDIPAFKKYEYRFVNGDLSYESEFVPDESRVGYNFVDNRWLYVDSLSNDTAFVGAILYGGNAPAGMYLVRYKVDMRNASPFSTNGIHVGASYQATAFNPAAMQMYDFEFGIYEIINYVVSGTYNYVFYNGNTLATAENVPSACAVGANRTITVNKDTVLPSICFSSCSACVGVTLGVTSNHSIANNFKLYPNPSNGMVNIKADFTGNYSLSIMDYSGKICSESYMVNENNQQLDLSHLNKGIYLAQLLSSDGSKYSLRFIIE